VEVNVTSDARGNVDLQSGTPGVDISALLLTIWPAVNVGAWPPRIAMGDDTWTSFVGPDMPDAGTSAPGHHTGLIQRRPPGP
jgi:hypothetical protein